jgi:DNA-binding NarL/FixJ family response regulator
MASGDATPLDTDLHESTGALRVVVAEDDALLREGIASLLNEAGHVVVGRARDAPDLMLKVRSYLPDVAIVDVRMPPGNADDGLVAAVEIRRATRRWRCSSSRNTSNRRTCSSSWETTPPASVTC